MGKLQRFLDDITLPVFVGLFVFIMTVTSPVTWGQGCSFFFYQIFSVLLPGMVIFQMFRIPQADTLERVLCGYGMGYVFVLLQYFLFASCRMLWLLLPFQVIIAILSVLFFLYCSQKEPYSIPKSSTGKDWLILGVFSFLVFGIRYVTYYGLNLLPSIEQDVTFPTQDILFYIGNAISAEKGFPLEEFRFAGQVFKYHYFGSIQLAAASVVTGIDALELEVCLEWLQPLILHISAFYLLMRRMGTSRKLRALGMGILLFTAGKELVVYVAYQHVMYKSPFGYDIGLAMGILFVTFLYMQHRAEHFHWGIFAGALLVFAACEGSKAPIAVICLFFAGCVCGMWLFSGRIKWAFAYGIPLLGVFAAVFFGFVSDGFRTVTTNTTGLKFDLTGHLYECGLGKIYFAWTAMGGHGITGKLLVLFLFYFGCNMVAYYLLLVFAGKLLFPDFKRIFSFEGCMLLTVLFGLVFTLVTKQQGNSQMYFAMFSFPLAVILSMRLWSREKVSRHWSGKLFYGGFLILLLYSFVSFVQILAPSFQGGMEKLDGVDTLAAANNSLTYEEKAAYDWIRTSTDENAVCVTNVILNDDQYESFIVGVCTERQMYMEGWRYVAGYLAEDIIFQRRNLIGAFFDGNQDALLELQEAGVEYAILVKRYDNVGEAGEFPLGTKVFENSGVSVYAISAQQ